MGPTSVVTWNSKWALFSHRRSADTVEDPSHQSCPIEPVRLRSSNLRVFWAWCLHHSVSCPFLVDSTSNWLDFFFAQIWKDRYNFLSNQQFRPCLCLPARSTVSGIRFASNHSYYSRLCLYFSSNWFVFFFAQIWQDRSCFLLVAPASTYHQTLVLQLPSTVGPTSGRSSIGCLRRLYTQFLGHFRWIWEDPSLDNLEFVPPQSPLPPSCIRGSCFSSCLVGSTSTGFGLFTVVLQWTVLQFWIRLAAFFLLFWLRIKPSGMPHLTFCIYKDFCFWSCLVGTTLVVFSIHRSCLPVCWPCFGLAPMLYQVLLLAHGLFYYYSLSQ